LEQAVALEVNGNTVGWLVRGRETNEWLRNTPEGAFLRQVNRAALVSALIGAGLALLVGSLIAYTLTRSLRELKSATEEIAQGRLGAQVAIRSEDELGELAASFNQMSRDLARATAARRQMTADIAHDLRTPLSVIAGYTEALSDGKLPGSAEVYGVLHQETQYLRRLIDDLRTLSLADAGELPLYRQPLAPQAMLEQAALRHGVAAREQEIALRVEAGPDLPPVEGDPQRLSQVFDNLILNALRHTPQGGEIVLSARRENDAQRGAGVQFQVQDSGSGIAAEDLPHIFNRFYRGDPSRQQNGESGLGLAIARSIVEAHGGTIGVESEAGKGAVFSIWMPEGEGKRGREGGREKGR
jgi:signal transduction histidine kinase